MEKAFGAMVKAIALMDFALGAPLRVDGAALHALGALLHRLGAVHKAIRLMEKAFYPVAKSLCLPLHALGALLQVLCPLLFPPAPSLKRPETRLFGLRQSDGSVEGDTRTGRPLEREEKRLDQVLEGEVGLVVLPLPPDGTIMQHLILRGH